MKLFSVISMLIVLNRFGNCARILGIFAAPGYSHYFLGKTLLKALAEKGHDVTMISCFAEKDPPTNGTYREIVLTELLEAVGEMRNSGQLNMFDSANMPTLISAFSVGIHMQSLMDKTFENKEVQELIRSDEKFDLVVVEQFLNDAQKALAKHFDAPLIVMSTIGANYWINALVGNPSPLSYIPDWLVDYSVPMTFYERVKNTIIYFCSEVFLNLYVFRNQEAIVKRYIPNGPDFKDAFYNISLVLLNSHVSISQPVPTVPAMVEIGGFHVEPPKKLPQDLQEFLDNAENGVIYFSMGSNLNSTDLHPEKRDAFLKAFSKLKENVLWKWEDDVLPGQPKNVKLAKWLPQNDILAHPNLKMFITHGGLLSTTETVYHGVPILAIPIYGDQKHNAKSATDRGYGILLPYSEVSEDKLTASINELLTNPKYRNTVKRVSALFRDRIVSPMDTAIYWVEYIIRHRGAPHLRVAALDLPWYKYHLLDVIAFLTLVVISSLYIFYRLSKIIWRKLRSQKITKKVKFS